MKNKEPFRKFRAQVGLWCLFSKYWMCYPWRKRLKWRENNSNILGGSMFKRKKYQQICSQITPLHKTFLEEKRLKRKGHLESSVCSLIYFWCVYTFPKFRISYKLVESKWVGHSKWLNSIRLISSHSNHDWKSTSIIPKIGTIIFHLSNTYFNNLFIV